MRNLFVTTLFLFMAATFVTAQDKPAYKLFAKDGKEMRYSKMLDELKKAEVVLFGEQHNDPIAHWLQLEVAKDLHKAHGQKLTIGAEMFETDVQLVLDEYLSGKVAENNFEQEARPWPNYKTDYKPVVKFAKEAGIPFVATNVPRRYAAIVAKDGLSALDYLTPEGKALIAPLPIVVDINLPGYKNMMSMFGGSTHGNTKAESIVQAQVLKDATMAYVILGQTAKGNKLLHLNGAYHSDNYEGIGWYLKQKQPDLKIATITTVTQEDLGKLSEEHRNKADFILVVPATMSKTY